MRIKKFRVQDASELQALVSQSLKQITSKYYSEKVIKQIISDFSPANLKLQMKTKNRIVVFQGSTMIGTGALTNDEWISGMFVHPRYTSTGVGTKILQYLERLARKKGFERLGTHSALNATEFYKKCGFRIVRKRKIKEYGTVYRMTKSLY